MSTATELAELEAAITEAELTDAEAEAVRERLQEDGGDPLDVVAAVIAEREGSREEPQPVTPDAIPDPTPEQLAKLERENERHLKTLERIMGPAFALFSECEACQGQGIAVSGEPEPDPVHPDKYRECPDCRGYGQQLTGSREPQYAHVSCTGCGGRGFQEQLPAMAPPTGTNPAQVTVTEEFGTPAWMGDPNVRPQAQWAPPSS